MDIGEFFGTDWRAQMSATTLGEAERLNALSPLDRAKAGWQIWQEDEIESAEPNVGDAQKINSFNGELRWNVWAKAYKDDFLVDIKKGEADPYGNGKRQIKRGDPDYLDRSIDFGQDMLRNADGIFEISHGHFSRFIFPGRVSFEGGLINQEAHFVNALFTAGAVFIKANFKDNVYFSSATFIKEPQFSRAAFDKEAYFLRAHFKDKADFSIATFAQDANFSEAEFSKRASFNMAAFTGNACFKEATFKGDAHFRHTIFTMGADFTYVTFNKQAIFQHTLFHCSSDFSFSVAERDIDFSNAYFLNRSQNSFETDFSHMVVKGSMLMNKVGFGSSRYYNADDPHNLKAKKLIESYVLTSRVHPVPNFIGLKVPEVLDLRSAEIKYHAHMHDMLASAKFKKLKEIATKTQQHGKVVEYFRQEYRHKKYSGEPLSWMRLKVWFYEVFARCGTSAIRPILWIAALIPLFALGYIYFSPEWILEKTTFNQALIALEFSTYQAIPFIEFSDLDVQRPVELLYGGYDAMPLKAWFLSLAHKITTLTLGFFVGHGLWNSFRK